MSISDKKAFKYILLMAILSLVFLVSAGVLVWYIDPFFHYHKPIEGFPYVIDNQLTQNPGMAEHMDYDSVILGSSMTVNFETDWFSELMDLKTLKLSYSSAYPKDISNILEKIYEPYADGREKNIKKVFLGLDIITYSGDINETKYPLPEYLYDKNVLNDINYLINKDVLLNYVLRPMVDPEPTNLSHVYASWWTDDYYNEDWVLLNHDAILEKKEEELPPEAFVDPIKKNLEANIIPYIENHKETEFVIFFPPYSILFWNDVIMDNRLEATMNAYRCVERELNCFDNVTMYYFPSMETIVTDLNNYADYTHYHPSINRMMAEAFVNGKMRIAKENQLKADSLETENKKVFVDEMEADMEGYLSDMEDIISKYDFETLRDKLYEIHGNRD